MDRLDAFIAASFFAAVGRGRALEGRLHRERALSMVIASRAVEVAPHVRAKPRRRRGPGAAEAPRHSGRDRLDRTLLRAGHRRRAAPVLGRLGRRRPRRRRRSRNARSSSAPNSPRSPILPAIQT